MEDKHELWSFEDYCEIYKCTERQMYRKYLRGGLPHRHKKDFDERFVPMSFLGRYRCLLTEYILLVIDEEQMNR